MLYSITGTVVVKRDTLLVLDVSGVAFKLFVGKHALAQFPDVGSVATAFCFLYVREDALDLYGFSSAKELELFERLLGVSGVGPKTGIGLLAVAPCDQLVAAINEGRTELLTRVSGVGRKTAERVVLELKGKLSLTASPQLLTLMESDVELEETLTNLGYSRAQARVTVSKIDPKVTGFKERLKEALRKTK